jgi:hypothetical protein
MNARSAVSSVVVLLFALLLCGCGEPLPTDAELRTAFLEAYPGAEIVKIDRDGQDASTSYIWFHYRMSGQAAVQKTMWQYTDSGEGKKKRVMIPTPKV